MYNIDQDFFIDGTELKIQWKDDHGQINEDEFNYIKEAQFIENHKLLMNNLEVFLGREKTSKLGNADNEVEQGPSPYPWPTKLSKIKTEDFFKKLSNGSMYSYFSKEEEHVTSMIKSLMTGDTTRGVMSTWRDCRNAISEIRSNRRKVVSLNSIAKERSTIKSKAALSITQQWPSANFAVEVYSDPHSCGVDPATRGIRLSDNTIKLHITWIRRVFNHGIAKAKAGNGPRFVLNAIPVTVKRNGYYRGRKPSNLEFRTYEAQTVQHKKNKVQIQNEWVLVYDGFDQSITAVGKNYMQAMSLLERRVKDATLRALDM
ncbi:MAG: hypothetical protein CMK24_00810 [Porticoccaceae bacterium]|nr:hypothetical protein [Porticoccaceae bacterium]|tara:strand:+ start:905 stop:1852 length:948 start_codon:yes stop_codon:yes gene_type:complete